MTFSTLLVDESSGLLLDPNKKLLNKSYPSSLLNTEFIKVETPNSQASSQTPSKALWYG